MKITLLLAIRLVLEPLAAGFDRPVQIVSSGNGSGHLFVAQQNGRVLMVIDGTVQPRPFLDLSHVVGCCANGGLLSIVFHPAYETNGRLFVLYVDKAGDTVLGRYSRATYDPALADPNSGEVLLVVPQPRDNVPNHHGGTVAFGPDGFLYVSIGDGGAYTAVTNRAQEKHHLLGKLLRIDVDQGPLYAIPPGNPFAGIPGVRGEIWSLGLRNPWRFSFDRATNELLLGDVGQDAWEEVNILTVEQARGANFGWPRMEASHCFPPSSSCDTAALTLPAVEYPRDQGCSVTGGFRYRGRRWSRLAGAYVYGDWCTGRIWTATKQHEMWISEESLDTNLAIVSFGQDDDGELYVVDYNGAVYRITAPGRRRAVRH